jgi:prepilin-type N-terminal cleavage/methylation domain-containing protein
VHDTVSRLRDRHREAGAPDQGMTLVELLVVMAIFGGLLAIVFSVLITVTRDSKNSIAASDEVEQMRLGLMQIDRQVRSGNVISDPATETIGNSGVASGYSMRVYTQTDGVYQCVQWRVLFAGASVVDGKVEYRSWDPAWRSTGEVRAWRVVSRNVARPTAGANKPFEKVASAGASKAQSVRVTLWHKSADSRATAKPMAVSTVLTGRNTVYGYPSDECSDVPAP